VTAAGPPQALVLDAELAEGNSGTSPMTFQIGLAVPTTVPVTVSYSTVNGTGIAGTDYTAVTGTVTIPPGGTLVGVPVSVIGNTATQADRAFTLKLTAVTNAALANSTATGTIFDDDGGHVPVSRPPGLYISDVYVIRGTNPSSGPGAVYRVFLDKPSASTISVHYATAAVTAVAVRDYTSSSGTLTFAPGETSKVLIVPIFGAAGTALTVSFKTTLTSPVNSYVSDAVGTTYLLANAGQPQLFVRDASVAEGTSGTTPMNFTVELAAPSALPVTVNYATSDGTAKTANGDYVAASGSVTIAAGQLSATVAVNVNGNALLQANRAFTLTLTTVSGAWLVDTTATGTILDDD
jgi:chitinase